MKNSIIDEVIEGLVIGGFSREQAESSRYLLNMIYIAGKTEGMQSQRNPGCQVCGITGITGYVCHNDKCPTKITC